MSSGYAALCCEPDSQLCHRPQRVPHRDPGCDSHWATQLVTTTVKVKVKVQVKFTLEQTTKAQRGSRGIVLLFLWPRGWMGWVVNAAPRPLHLRERPGTHCMGLDRCRKSPPPGFNPRTVQPVASRYRDWAILAHNTSPYSTNLLAPEIYI
jgi:hypothetical protein